MKEQNTFHSQDAVLRISLWANIVSWIVLVLYLLNFSNDVVGLVQNWPPQLPSGVFEQIVAWAGLVSKPMFGVMYFLVLQGITQLLNLGLDLFLNSGSNGEAEEK